jgi:outer membrane receptor protein involved in Fe transport
LGAVAVAIALLAAVPSFAQTTGRIEGRVLDSSGAVLPGATMTVSGPNLQGTRTITSDTDGRFRFLALPPGTYTVKGELPGFSTVEQSSVRVQLDSTVSLELSMNPAAVTETVTVTGTAPVIDVTSTTTGAKFDNQLFDRLPVARNYQALALAAPSVTTGGLGTNNPSVGGASAAENRYVVDGLDTTDPAFGTSNVSLPMEFIQEVEVKTGGYQAEYTGALGGILNVLTKSGSNQLKGDIFGYYTDDSLRNSSPRTVGLGQDLGIEREFDFGADIGGKLVEDKLWFFAAANPTFTDNGFLSRSGAPFTREIRKVLFSGKLTWQASPNHQIVGSIFGDPGTDLYLSSRNAIGLMTQEADTATYNYNATYNGILSSGLFLKLSAGRSDQREEDRPISDAPFYEERIRGGNNIRALTNNNPACGDINSAVVLGSLAGVLFRPDCAPGGTFEQESGDRSRTEFTGALSWFTKTGSVAHEIKVGTNIRRVKYRDHSHYPGPVAGPIVDETGAVVDAEGLAGQRYRLFADSYSLIEYDQNSNGTTDELGVFIQDQLKFGDRVTLNLGVRFDSSHSTGDNSVAGARELDFGLGDMIAPRIGAVIDVTGDGRSKLFGHWGRFYESIPLDINVRAFGREQFNFYYFYYPSNGSLPSGTNQGTFYYLYQAGGGGVAVQEGIEAMYSDETVAGFEYEVAKDLSLGVKGVYRTLGQVIEDISVDNAHTYFIANVGKATTYTVNPVTGEALATPTVFPAAERKYKALEFTLNKAFSNNWQWNASYVLSKNEGNYGGLFRQDNGQLDPNITSLFDLPSLLRGAFGPLPNDRRHQFKTYGTYRFPFNLTAGVFAEYLSGVPISKLGAHNLYGRRERFIGDRGSFGTTPNIWHVDLHLEYPIKVSDRTELRLIADAFNITNQQEAAVVDNEWTLRGAPETTDINECGGADLSCASANPTWGEATTFQTPRAVRFGVKLSW